MNKEGVTEILRDCINGKIPIKLKDPNETCSEHKFDHITFLIGEYEIVFIFFNGLNCLDAVYLNGKLIYKYLPDKNEFNDYVNGLNDCLDLRDPINLLTFEELYKLIGLLETAK